MKWPAWANFEVRPVGGVVDLALVALFSGDDVAFPFPRLLLR